MSAMRPSLAKSEKGLKLHFGHIHKDVENFSADSENDAGDKPSRSSRNSTPSAKTSTGDIEQQQHQQRDIVGNFARVDLNCGAT